MRPGERVSPRVRALVCVGPAWICASILILAASFKAHQLLTDSTLGTLSGSRWPQIVLIECELLLAWWLISGALPQYCRWAAIATFTAFASYALYLGLTGAASCGCFGQVRVSPWSTFVLDCGALVLLCRSNPAGQVAPSLRLTRLLGATVGLAVISVIAYYSVLGRSPELQVLEPKQWVGHRFALLESIDIGAWLSRGNWVVVLVREDCPLCRDSIPQYERLAESYSLDGKTTRIALVQVPPLSDHQRTAKGKCIWGRLDERRTWFVTTPAEIKLQDGFVVSVLQPSQNQAG